MLLCCANRYKLLNSFRLFVRRARCPHVIHSGCGSSVEAWEWPQTALFLWPIFQTKHEFESGPYIVDGTNFYINHALRESNFPDNISIKIRFDAGSFFRPRDPKDSGRSKFCGLAREFFRKRVAAPGKEQNKVAGLLRFAIYRHALG